MKEDKKMNEKNKIISAIISAIIMLTTFFFWLKVEDFFTIHFLIITLVFVIEILYLTLKSK